MMKNQPETYPLQRVVPRYEFLITDPQGRVALLESTHRSRENLVLLRKRSWTFDNNGAGGTSQQTTTSTIRSIDEESLSSCDDMLVSDTDTTNSLLSLLHLSMMSILKDNRIVHPPKRRLMVPSGQVVSRTITEESQMGQMVQSVTVSTDIRTPTAFTSPSNTPISVTDEEVDMTVTQQLLPLPSPSASPVYAKDEEDEATLQRAVFTVPQNQQELLLMIHGLLLFLSETNQNHLIFKLLQNVNRLNLLLFNNLIHNSLRRDLLLNLPLEITYKILQNLDYKTICLLLLVCQNWNKMINSSGIWADMLKRDRLITDDAEIERELRSPDLIKWAANPQLSNLNMTQLLFKKRRIILNRWMDPSYEPKRLSVLGHGSHVVTSLQVDQDKIVTGVEDKLINIYLTKTGELVRVLKGHDGGVWAMKYTGNTLVSGLTDRTVRIWNINTGRCTHVFRGHTLTVRCLDIIHPATIGVDDNGNAIVFPESPLLVTGSRDHDLRVWKLPLVDEDDEDDEDDISEPIEVEARSDAENPYLVTVLTGHTHSVRLVSTFGNIVLSGSYDTTVRVWDLLEGGRCKHILTGHQEKIYLTALDFKNKRCYLGSMDSTIKVWDIEKGKLLNTLDGHISLVGLLELSEDYLVSAAADTTLRVWDPQTGRNISKLEGHSAAITCFQHDNLRIVSGSEKMLKLWDIKTGKFVRDLLADITGGIWQVRFDFCRCVAAAQRNINDVDETFIEIVDFSTPPS